MSGMSFKLWLNPIFIDKPNPYELESGPNEGVTWNYGGCDLNITGACNCQGMWVNVEWQKTRGVKE